MFLISTKTDGLLNTLYSKKTRHIHLADDNGMRLTHSHLLLYCSM